MARCEHPDENYVGKCAICGDMVCGDCFQTLFTGMICDEHGDLEDESAWELVGFYTSQHVLEERRYALEENSLASIAVETEDDIIELWVPGDQKEESIETMMVPSDETMRCPACSIFYSKDMGACPVCGIREPETEH